MALATYRILLTYNIHPERQEMYYQYMLGEFVPTLQKLNLRMLFAWHVHGDDYPQRQVEFICESRALLRAALEDPEFVDAEERLQTYITGYSRKIVRFKDRFQF